MRSVHFGLKSAAIAAMAALACAVATPANAASSDDCAGGGFTVTGLVAGRTLGPGEHTVRTAQLNPTFRVVGRYVEFTVVVNTLGIRDYTLTGVPNSGDLTGGRRLVVWSEKTPDHRGRVLDSNVTIEIGEDEIVIERSGGRGFLDAKIQAKDCTQGGIFQMEIERDDNLPTRYTHVLGPDFFYFDNPNFRAREGDLVPFRDQTLEVPARINIGTDASRRFVARDSAQVAERVDEPSCVNEIETRTGEVEEVLHCGRVSRWDVASGGRMGFVSGEDAVEVAPGATDCTRRCQAQNRTRGAAVVLGFPFPVPADVRLRPDFITIGLAER
ncbi:MAG: hypothetical protein AB7O98_04110 [Hyphomonadaceae bacterium]